MKLLSLFLWLGLAGLGLALANGSGLTGAEEALLRTVERQMEAPGFLMAILWEESKHATENNLLGDCGPFGIQPGTASDVIGYRVTCLELQSVTFSLAIATIYLTSPQWCGRYPLTETRLLCYRIGHNRRAMLRAYKHVRWWQMHPRWGTRKIMQRLWAANKLNGTLTRAGGG